MRVTSCVATKRPDYALNEEIHHNILTKLTIANRQFLMNSMKYLLYYFDNKESKVSEFMKEVSLLSSIATEKGIIQEFQIFFWDLMAWEKNYGRTKSFYLELEEN